MEGNTTCTHARKHAQGKKQLEEEQNVCKGGITSVGRVRVLVIHCKWMKSPIYINRDTKVSYRGWFTFVLVWLL